MAESIDIRELNNRIESQSIVTNHRYGSSYCWSKAPY